MTMKITQHANGLISDMHAHIEPLSFPLINVELEEELASHTIKVNMGRKPTSATSETYNINMSSFEYGQPEDFLALLNNFRIVIDGTGTTSLSGQMNYLSTMLHVEDLREFDQSSSQNNGTTNAHLKHITEGLLGSPPNQCHIQAKVCYATRNAQTSKNFVQAFHCKNNINKYLLSPLTWIDRQQEDVPGRAK